MDFKKRLQDATASAAPSMVPNILAPPEKEPVPILSEAIKEKKDYLTLKRLIEESVEWQLQESEAKSKRKPLTAKIKSLLGKYKVGQATLDNIRVSYFSTTYKKISQIKLLELGVRPETIAAATEESTSFTLKLTMRKEGAEEEPEE